MSDHRLVIMMSGGLDSYLAWHYALKEKDYKEEEIFPLWINLGQPYARKEKEAISSFEFEVHTVDLTLLRPEFGNVPTIDNQIIPGRNLILAAIAASFGQTIWLSALDGEMHKFMPDKTQKFLDLASELFSYVFDNRLETKVISPFTSMSKSDIVKWSLSKGVTVEQILNTSTCYHTDHKACGECSTCFKRKVALINNNIEEDYEKNPFVPANNEYMRTTVPKMLKDYKEGRFDHYSKKRCLETFSALRKVGNTFYDLYSI